MFADLKRYVVIADSCYYPSGFEQDLFYDYSKDNLYPRFETLEQAKIFVADNIKAISDFDIAYIFDVYEWKRVWNKDSEGGND